MNKFYTLFIAASISTVSFSQNFTSDFESFIFPADSFQNGSLGNGNFFEDHAEYENNYDDAWGSWSGFSISNKTDITTPGYLNQYSSFTGGGDNSENFAVFYPFLNEGIKFDGGVTLQSMKITNTTYSALSMRDGDGYGKQFGSSLNAEGIDDGTNGEDFFKVWIIGTNYAGDKDSVDFYLADYRFADNNLDYIVDTWEEIDLSFFTSAIVRLDFRFESSDMDGAWLRTPSYFAMDNLMYYYNVGVDELSIQSDVYPNPTADFVTVSGEYDSIELIDALGKVVISQDSGFNSKLDLSSLENGIYSVRASKEGIVHFARIIKK